MRMRMGLALCLAAVAAGCGGGGGSDKSAAEDPAPPVQQQPQQTPREVGWNCVVAEVDQDGVDPETAAQDCIQAATQKFGMASATTTGLEDGAYAALSCIFTKGTVGCANPTP